MIKYISTTLSSLIKRPVFALPYKQRKQNNAGFTLIEILISMTILTILMIATAHTINVSLKTKNTIQEINKKHQILDFLIKLDSDINNISLNTYWNSIRKKNSDANTYLIGYSGEGISHISFTTNTGDISALVKNTLLDVRYTFKDGVLKRTFKPFLKMLYGEYQNDIIISNIKSVVLKFYIDRKPYTFFPNPNFAQNVVPQGIKMLITTKQDKVYEKWIYVPQEGL